jgi:hypothetical protein
LADLPSLHCAGDLGIALRAGFGNVPSRACRRGLEQRANRSEGSNNGRGTRVRQARDASSHSWSLLFARSTMERDRDVHRDFLRGFGIAPTATAKAAMAVGEEDDGGAVVLIG